jgi:DNA/RNA endonuclease G (NUC1)
MELIRKAALLFLFVSLFGSCTQRHKVQHFPNQLTPANPSNYYPGFSLSYNEQHEQADWVAYELTAEEADGPFERTDNFREDSSITTGSATLEDYKSVLSKKVCLGEGSRLVV